MTQAWNAVVREHDEVLQRYVRRMRAVPAERWTTPRAPGKWSAAQEALHVAMAYEAGIRACSGGTAMKLVTSPAVAWASRNVLLPLILRLRIFPPNAPAPREVRPDAALAAGIPQDEMEARLRETAERAVRELREADGRQPPLRVMHAYFGPLTPLVAMRVLVAHTRHHARAR